MTYVYDGTEVKLTGRTARKDGERRTARGRVSFIDILVEITPTDKNSPAWKKWVKKEELYKINNENEEKNNNGILP